MNFSLYSGSDGDVLSKVLRGKPDIEKPDTTLPKNREDVQLQDSSKGCIIPQAHTIPQPTDTSTAPTPSLVPEKDDVNITDPRPIKQKSQNYIIDTIQEKIKNGTYEIDIAPSDLVDFGGQRSFDMTHQLFMRHKGTFVLMFNGTIDLSMELTKDEGETTECKLVSDFINLIFFLLTCLEGSRELLQSLCVRRLSCIVHLSITYSNAIRLYRRI